MTKVSILLMFIITLFSCADGQNNTAKVSAKKHLDTEVGIIKFDETITGFKFATMLDNKFLYTPKGKADLSNEYRTWKIRSN